VEIVVVTYNIQRGWGLDLRRDLDRAAGVLARIAPDVVAVQEVTREEGTERGDQAAYLARALGMQFVRYEARPHGRGTYGHAILTRFPVVATESCDLTVGRGEARGCLRADVRAGEQLLHVFGCHLGLGLRERRQQVRTLLAFLRRAPVGHRVLMGDMNEWHAGPVMRELSRELGSVAHRPRTHPAFAPVFALDRIHWDVPLRGRIHAYRERPARLASDHLPLVATLRF